MAGHVNRLLDQRVLLLLRYGDSFTRNSVFNGVGLRGSPVYSLSSDFRPVSEEGCVLLGSCLGLKRLQLGLFNAEGSQLRHRHCVFLVLEGARAFGVGDRLFRDYVGCMRGNTRLELILAYCRLRAVLCVGVCGFGAD